MNNLVLGIQIALLFSGCIIGGIILGVPVGRFLGISPWGVVGGAILGVFLASVVVAKMLKEK